MPYYLSVGMTPQDFWHGDPELVRIYRSADELRVRRADSIAWLQGMYVYEAIWDVAPILRPLSKARKPMEYAKKPYLRLAYDKERENELETRLANGRIAAQLIAKRVERAKEARERANGPVDAPHKEKKAE